MLRRVCFYGEQRSVTWTHLASTVEAGATKIVVEQEVDWRAGEQIVIAPTSFTPNEADVAIIKSVSAVDKKTITLEEPLKFRHISAEETAGSHSYSLKAEVGLLTRNIRIMGEEKALQEEQAFGGRVIVSEITVEDKEGKNQIITGSANFSNVEFYKTGQLGWTDFFDPHYSLVFLDVGDVKKANRKLSTISKCSFHDSYAPAVGVFGTNTLKVEKNVAYKTVGSAMVVWGDKNELLDNLIITNLWPSTFQGRKEVNNKMEGAIEIGKSPFCF